MKELNSIEQFCSTVKDLFDRLKIAEEKLAAIDPEKGLIQSNSNHKDGFISIPAIIKDTAQIPPLSLQETPRVKRKYTKRTGKLSLSDIIIEKILKDKPSGATFNDIIESICDLRQRGEYNTKASNVPQLLNTTLNNLKKSGKITSNKPEGAKYSVYYLA